MWTVKDLIKELEKLPENLPISITVSVPNDDYIGGYEEIDRDIEDISIDTNNKEVIIQA